jgi:hypothetical protein
MLGMTVWLGLASLALLVLRVRLVNRGLLDPPALTQPFPVLPALLVLTVLPVLLVRLVPMGVPSRTRTADPMVGGLSHGLTGPQLTQAYAALILHPRLELPHDLAC